MLEAWIDWIGEGNGSLSYVEPLENSLGSVWEFLSGMKQNLWEEYEDKEWQYEDGILDDIEEGEVEEWEEKAMNENKKRVSI